MLYLLDIIISDLTYRFEARKKLYNLLFSSVCFMKLSHEELGVNLKEMIAVNSNDLSLTMLDEL